MSNQWILKKLVCLVGRKKYKKFQIIMEFFLFNYDVTIYMIHFSVFCNKLNMKKKQIFDVLVVVYIQSIATEW